MTSKSIAALALAVTFVFTQAGCAKKKDVSQNGKIGNFEFTKDEVSFTWYNNSDTAASTPWADTSLIEKWVQENLKVNIKYMDPGGASAEKMATMIVSDSFPDLMTMKRGQDTAKLIKSKKMVPLNDFMNKYTVMKNDFAPSRIFEMMQAEDGKNYEIPNWANASGNPNGNNAWGINIKVYEELGRPKLESFDDLYLYLKKVKEKYPDMVPYETTDVFQGERYVLSGMAENLPPDNLDFFAYPENDKFVSIFKHPAYKETMLYLNKLFSEKLMTQDAFSQTADQVKEKYSNNKVAVTSAAINMYDGTRTNLKKMGSDWTTIPPLMKDGLDRKKVYSQGYDRLGWTELLITKDAKNPEGIYAYIDWLYSPEGQRHFSYGPKGTYYEEVTKEGYPALNQKWFTLPTPIKDLKGNGAGAGFGNTSFVDACGIYIDGISPEAKKSWGKKQQLTNIWSYAKDITEYSNIIPSANTDEGIIFQTITELYKDARAKMIFASSGDEVTKILDKLIVDTDKAGMDKLLAMEEKGWKENKSKLVK